MIVEEAAKKLGMNAQTLRLALQQRLFPFGVAVKTSENRYTYYISPTRLEKYIGGVDYETHHDTCCGNGNVFGDSNCFSNSE